MKIALLSDAHANLPSLEAVIAHARSLGAREFWNLGDMVGYSPFPNETVSLIEKTCAQNILGNYDEKTVSPKKIEKMRAKGRDADKVFSFVWTNGQLTKESVRFIKALPETLVVTVEGKKVLLTHGSPEGIDDELMPETPLARFEELAGKVGVNIVLCGHTHRFFVKTAGGVMFVNPGSVGRSFDGDVRASYAVLEIDAAETRVTPYRVEFDVERVAEKMRAERFPERLIRSLVEARSLDDLDAPSLDSPAAGPEALGRVLEFGEKCRYDKRHAHQVARLALRLFDELGQLHALGPRERFLLQSAALLHDIGMVRGLAGHHKSSRDLILESPRLLLSPRDRMIVATVARYHRKALPDNKHDEYGGLSVVDRGVVDRLAAILRVADGLDRSHLDVVKDLSVHIDPAKISLTLKASGLPDAEIQFALLKSDLFQKVFQRSVEIKK